MRNVAYSFENICKRLHMYFEAYVKDCIYEITNIA